VPEASRDSSSGTFGKIILSTHRVIIRRATYEEAKHLKDFDPFIGDRRIDNWRGELFIYAIRNDIAGFVSYSSNSFYDRPFIKAVCVAEPYRRHGVAFELIRQVLTVYSGIEVWASTEHDNISAQSLFIKSGFIKRGEISDLDGKGTCEFFYCHEAIL